MQPGEIVLLEPLELVAGGDAIARVDGFPIFVPGVYPGDLARVRLTEVRKGFGRAELVELVRRSGWRRALPCPVAEECGGCDWTALRLDRQLDAKRRILAESLRRIGKLDPASLPPIVTHASPLNYRLRSRLHHDGAATGFYAARSNRVVPLPAECEVVGPATARHFSRTSTPPPDGDLWEIDGRLAAGDTPLTVQVESFGWQLSPQSFFQVNRHLLGTMIRLVSAHAASVRDRAVAVDLYAGVGFFTLPIAKHFDRVVAVEGSPESVRWARRNAPRHVRILHAPVERQVENLEPADFVFLDPPRAGSRAEVISTIARTTREKIAYLSCDPVTFSRDASRLIASGWRLATLDLLDLFPNTHHVETLCSFERAQ
jgi:tRNA/tmRNA/rRNA uracil-C5-methylase (TrmA/RlmC/RlmD family)